MDRRTLALRNRAGTEVDPWPFVVVSGLSFLLAFSVGPVYLLSFGLSLPLALGGSALTCCGLVGAAHYRLVWLATPDLAGELPAGSRIQRLFYWTVALALILFGLSLPFLADVS